MTTTRAAILADLPAVRNRRVMLERDQDVQDIIRSITHYHKKYVPHYDQIAQQFDIGDERQIARALWRFCRDNIAYDIQDEKVQSVRSPARILTEGRGDCKHYASFIAGVLDGLKRSGLDLDWAYRFADYVNRWTGEVNHHVFVVLFLPNGKEIWIDPVLNWFDYHLPYDKGITRRIDTLSAAQKMGCLQLSGCNCHMMGATGDQYLAVPAGYPSNIPRPVLTADHKLVIRDNYKILTPAEIAWIQQALQPLIIQYAPKPYNIYWSLHGWGSGAGDISVAANRVLSSWLSGNAEKDFLQFPKQPSALDNFLIGLNDIVPSLIAAGANAVVPGSGGIASTIVANESGGGGGNTSLTLSPTQLQNTQQPTTASLLPGVSTNNLLPWLIIAGGIYLLTKH